MRTWLLPSFLAMAPILAQAGAVRILTPTERAGFEQWFTFLAESQFYISPAKLPREVNDCAALVRYAYRESLRLHDAAWAQRVALPRLPALRPFPAQPIDPRFTLPNRQLAHFADARTLRQHNTTFISRNLPQARPGDLLFFHQDNQQMPFHVMIYIGPSHYSPQKEAAVVYHTGPVASDPGEIRRLSLPELLNHPEPRWRPHAANSHFLGIYRWNLLTGGAQ